MWHNTSKHQIHSASSFEALLGENERPMKKTLLLLSGGLDSVTMLQDMAQDNDVHCLMFDYGQPHKIELAYALKHVCGICCTLVDLPSLGGMTDNDPIVPNRNMIFISIAVNYAIKLGASQIAIGCNADDSDAFPDCRGEFIESINNTIRAAGYDVIVIAPYLNKTKKWIADRALSLGISLDDIWTCYHPVGELPCNQCHACLKLKEAKCTQ